MAKASAHVASSLRELILRGQFAAGERLGEADLADRLRVSRTPVREALSRLAAEGLVELSPGRGARVVQWSAEDLGHIFEVRLRLEPYAVRTAVPRLAPADLDELDGLAGRMSRLGRPEVPERGDAGGPGGPGGRDLDGLVELNRRFHGLLIDRAGNAALAASLTAVTHASVVHQNFHHYTPDALARSLAHHVEIVAAARAGAPGWAESVMRSHLHNARATMLGPGADR